MKVETRRDRDGFAIVKTSFKQEFKYDLDEILAYDPVKIKEKEMANLELLLEQALTYL